MSSSSDKGEVMRTSAYSVFIKEQVQKFGLCEEKAEDKWRTLRKRQRENYKQIAKDLNYGLGSNISIPIDLQTSFIDKQVMALKSKNFDMKSDVKELIFDAFESGFLDTTKFLILSINTYFEDAHDVHICEMAMAKFSLKHGIIKDFQVEICPGMLPSGAECQARLKSMESHRYELPAKGAKESDYIQVLLQMIDILENDDQFEEGFPIIFTEGNTKGLPEQKLLINTQRAMVKIIEKCCEYKLATDIKVYPLSMLVYYLDKVISLEKNLDATGKVQSYQNVAEAHVNFDFAMHDYEVTTEGCDFHNEIDAKKSCCLSKVRRFSYALAKLFSNPQKYQFVEGRHYPEGYNAFDNDNNGKI